MVFAGLGVVFFGSEVVSVGLGVIFRGSVVTFVGLALGFFVEAVYLTLAGAQRSQHSPAVKLAGII